MNEEKEPHQAELIICTCDHKWYKHHKEVGQNVYECEKCGNDNSEFYKDTAFNKESSNLKNYGFSTMPIVISIRNNSQYKTYENVKFFDYKRNEDLSYSTPYGPELTYEDILRLLLSVTKNDDKQIHTISIRTDKLEQLIENCLTYKVTSMDGRSLSMPVPFPSLNEEQKQDGIVDVYFNKYNLFNGSNIIISKLLPKTTIDILIYPTEETKNF